ncbi:hypothetical protein DHEL01_v204769 [Diaporthe helianthi]|uniref:Uncharacterized protein n=1 Tax=Diaporthe helianthi TaxID=158607 RepID=A0A2P5I2V7_DIAHE|nr:hypothetical protein DHEL01_v204769 [Diaporthe helianthi]
MSGITDAAATQAHDVVEQAEAQEQKVQGGTAMTGEGEPSEGSSTAATGDQHAEGETKSKLDKVKEALHLKK